MNSLDFTLISSQQLNNTSELCIWNSKLYAATDNGIYIMEKPTGTLVRFTTSHTSCLVVWHDHLTAGVSQGAIAVYNRSAEQLKRFQINENARVTCMCIWNDNLVVKAIYSLSYWQWNGTKLWEIPLETSHWKTNQLAVFSNLLLVCQAKSYSESCVLSVYDNGSKKEELKFNSGRLEVIHVNGNKQIITGYGDGSVVVTENEEDTITFQNRQGMVHVILLWRNLIFTGHNEHRIIVTDIQGERLGEFGAIENSSLAHRSLCVWRDAYLATCTYSVRGGVTVWRDEKLWKFFDGVYRIGALLLLANQKESKDSCHLAKLPKDLILLIVEILKKVQE